MSTPPIRLYGAGEIGTMLGLSRHWVIKHYTHPDAPRADYTTMHGTSVQSLWSAEALDHWRAFHAGEGSIPRNGRYTTFSDHHSVNHVGKIQVTWKLSWRCAHSGGVVWWFSTPDGWFTSSDDGRSWEMTGSMLRPSEYHYIYVNDVVRPSGAVAALLREVEKLRRRLEGVTHLLTPTEALTTVDP